mmetsp:Transcript_25666/g.50249  ORF Transcript_25666/g.50249 Transcript_25666/m.50249 type:complete len:409 (-) Transcript_25666:28-1254(-)
MWKLSRSPSLRRPLSGVSLGNRSFAANANPPDNEASIFEPPLLLKCAPAARSRSLVEWYQSSGTKYFMAYLCPKLYNVLVPASDEERDRQSDVSAQFGIRPQPRQSRQFLKPPPESMEDSGVSQRVAKKEREHKRFEKATKQAVPHLLSCLAQKLQFEVNGAEFRPIYPYTVTDKKIWQRLTRPELETKLVSRCRALRDAGLRFDWRIRRMASLSVHRAFCVLGHKRGEELGTKRGKWFHGQMVLLDDSELGRARRVDLDFPRASALYESMSFLSVMANLGATFYMDLLVTVKQEARIRKGDEILWEFPPGPLATHAVRLETELSHELPAHASASMQGDKKKYQVPPVFVPRTPSILLPDGQVYLPWRIADINGMLGGNACVSPGFKGWDADECFFDSRQGVVKRTDT